MNARNFVKLCALVVLASMLVVVVGCGGGYRTSSVNGHKKVYKVDEDGNKTMVYEVDKEGNVTIHDENDPQAQQVMAQQKKMEETEVAKDARYERIKKAPKRKAGDPILVAFYETELGEQLAQAEKPEGAVFKQICQEFESDQVISLVENQANKGEFTKFLAGLDENQPPTSDVEVVTRGYIKQVTGYNKQTGKVGEMTTVVFEATITSNYLPAEYTVSESGNIFKNTEVTRKFANKIKRVIMDKIGPTLPADRNI